MIDRLIQIMTVVMLLACIFMVAELYQRHEATTVITNNVVYVNHDPEALIKRVFGDEWPIAMAVAMAESHMIATKVGDQHLTYTKDGAVYGDSIGLFQIRTFSDRPPRELLMDPYVNVQFAYRLRHMKRSGLKGWNQWTTFTNGSYKKFLPVVKAQSKKRSI